METLNSSDKVGKWILAHTYRTNMLHNHGDGSGVTSRTVSHAQVTRGFVSGRLVRSDGQYLCLGRSTPLEISPDRIQQANRITCPRCIKLVARHNILFDEAWQEREEIRFDEFGQNEVSDLMIWESGPPQAHKEPSMLKLWQEELTSSTV